MEKRSKNAGLKFYLFMDQQNLNGGLKTDLEAGKQPQNNILKLKVMEKKRLNLLKMGHCSLKWLNQVEELAMNII